MRYKCTLKRFLLLIKAQHGFQHLVVCFVPFRHNDKELFAAK